MEDIQSAAADVKEDLQAAVADTKPSQEDLLAALRAAKDLIDSLREYNRNLATSVDDQKDQIEMLKEKLYETNVPDGRIFLPLFCCCFCFVSFLTPSPQTKRFKRPSFRPGWQRLPQRKKPS